MVNKKYMGEDYRDYLHRYGLKSTRTRNMVLHMFIENEGVLTAETIYRQLIGDQHRINFSTVYRILEMFTEKKVIIKTLLPNSRTYGFLLRASGHTHRLICLRCHQIVEIADCPLSDFENILAQNTHFQIAGHHLEIYGYCQICQEERLQEALATTESA
ncbi:Fur family transcriptional regulator [uncultured Megasphaera sp.]|uniref:Fur family transcriptional regulator n=1 Tax=uncultured Megasphaera sp. TaxID=165188 RepID=UPI002592EE6E|nr:Fur family transcriptional regulator [uncultured Megasphaera sp.]